MGRELSKEKVAIKILSKYLLLMVLSMIVLNLILVATSMHNNLLIVQISQIILQGVCSLYIVKSVNQYYGWQKIGFKKIEIKNIIWIMPHLIIIFVMLAGMIKGIFIKSSELNTSMYFILFINLIGCILAAGAEEIIFRGIMLNAFTSNKSVKKGLIIGSLGFGIIHIGTVFIGVPFIDALAGTIRAGIFGFAMATLTIKLNSIIPAIIFHTLWNYIIMASQLVNIEISIIYILANPVHIIIGASLCINILRSYKIKTSIS